MTTPPLDEAKARAAATYNAASDHYDDEANAFWERFGRRTVDRLRLQPGAHVLDVCCGSGASALPAAAAVGTAGSVLGVDLAENMLALARSKASKRGLTNVEFRVGDMLAPPIGDRQLDAVVCVFGVFFVPDVPAAVRSLWHAVRPGGQLAIDVRPIPPDHTEPSYFLRVRRELGPPRWPAGRQASLGCNWGDQWQNRANCQCDRRNTKNQTPKTK